MVCGAELVVGISGTDDHEGGWGWSENDCVGEGWVM